MPQPQRDRLDVTRLPILTGSEYRSSYVFTRQRAFAGLTLTGASIRATMIPQKRSTGTMSPPAILDVR